MSDEPAPQEPRLKLKLNTGGTPGQTTPAQPAAPPAGPDGATTATRRAGRPSGDTGTRGVRDGKAGAETADVDHAVRAPEIHPAHAARPNGGALDARVRGDLSTAHGAGQARE